MSEQKHTPTPWSYIVGKTLIHIETDASNPSGAGIPICSIPKRDKGNAALIVHRVNHWQSLVDALEAIYAALMKDARQKSIIGDDTEYHLDGGAMSNALEKTRAALTKAKEVL